MADQPTRFTERAGRVFALAQEEAVTLGHARIAPAHLLVGLLREGEGVAARVLRDLCFELAALRDAIAATLKRGEHKADMELTPAARQVVERGVAEARGMGHIYAGTEHVLLGLLGQDDPVILDLFAARGVRPDDVRSRLLATLDQTASPVEQPASGDEQGREGRRSVCIARGDASMQVDFLFWLRWRTRDAPPCPEAVWWDWLDEMLGVGPAPRHEHAVFTRYPALAELAERERRSYFEYRKERGRGRGASFWAGRDPATIPEQVEVVSVPIPGASAPPPTAATAPPEEALDEATVKFEFQFVDHAGDLCRQIGQRTWLLGEVYHDPARFNSLLAQVQHEQDR